MANLELLKGYKDINKHVYNLTLQIVQILECQIILDSNLNFP